MTHKFTAFNWDNVTKSKKNAGWSLNIHIAFEISLDF